MERTPNFDLRMLDNRTSEAPIMDCARTTRTTRTVKPQEAVKPQSAVKPVYRAPLRMTAHGMQAEDRPDIGDLETLQAALRYFLRSESDGDAVLGLRVVAASLRASGHAPRHPSREKLMRRNVKRCVDRRFARLS